MEKFLNKKLRALMGFPGSVLLIPMFFSAILNTFLPGIVMMGEPVTSLLNGSGVMTLLFMMLFISGLKLEISNIVSMLKKTVFLLVGRLIWVSLIYTLLNYVIGVSGVWQVSTLVLLIAFFSTNPGIFVALIGRYGKKEDISLFGPLNILALPAIPLAILSVNSGSGLELMQFVALLLPFILGAIIGNLFERVKQYFQGVTPIILFFWGLGIGSKINLVRMTEEIYSGMILVLLFYLFMMIPMVIAERKLIGGNGLLTMSSSSVAAVSLIIPQLAAGISEKYEPYLEQTTNQLAFAVVITSILTPLIVQKVSFKLKG